VNSPSIDSAFEERGNTVKTMQSFSSVLDAVDKLSIEDQEALIEVIKRRILEYRRTKLASEIRQAQHELKTGNCSPASSSDILNEVLA
jgi:hypothetical protein